MILKRIIQIFRSIKLAIILIGYIIIASVAATLIPQGLEPKYYLNNYNFFIAKLILFFRFDIFFYSFTFILPALLFFISITSCSIYRIYNRHKQKLKKKYGPDLIHIGIILIFLGGGYSLFFREEKNIFLGESEKINLNDGYQIELKEFNIKTYPNGAVKDWISRVEITKYGKFIKIYNIEVNKPCSFGQYKVYQYSYKISIDSYFVSGLSIVKDNSYVIVFSAIFIILLGLLLTYYNRIKELK